MCLKKNHGRNGGSGGLLFYKGRITEHLSGEGQTIPSPEAYKMRIWREIEASELKNSPGK